jgi:isoleucyl-tRNA synthetase
MDRWILSRLAGLSAQVSADFAGYEVTRAARAVGEFIVDDVSNWYVRRSRDRFWGTADNADARAAFRTLHDVLITVSRLLAPVTPFHADWLHRALASGASVHLAAFPSEADSTAARPREERLEQGMSGVRTLARLGRAARETAKIRVRQPLRVLHAVAPNGAVLSAELLAVLRDELNVKEVRFLHGTNELVELRAQPNFRVIGKRFGERTQQAARSIRALGTEQLQEFRQGGSLVIEVDGETFPLNTEEFEIVEEARGDLVVESDQGYTVALDRTIDEALRLEGIARELVNRIQRLRRETGLQVSDRIRLGVYGDSDVRHAVAGHKDYIAGETLAVEILTGEEPADARGPVHEVELDGKRVRMTMARE